MITRHCATHHLFRARAAALVVFEGTHSAQGNRPVALYCVLLSFTLALPPVNAPHCAHRAVPRALRCMIDIRGGALSCR